MLIPTAPISTVDLLSHKGRFVFLVPTTGGSYQRMCRSLDLWLSDSRIARNMFLSLDLSNGMESKQMETSTIFGVGE